MSKLKRLLAPKFWGVPKKVAKWTVSPRPGPHKKFESIPLLIIARNILNLAETWKEAKSIIKKGEILVDNKARKDHAFPVGLMDVVSVLRIKKHYRVLPSKKGLEMKEIPEDEANKKICRINNKILVKKGRLQLNLHDGRNLLVEKDVYKTGDSVLLELPSQKILEHIKLEKGSLGLITKGKNSGKTARIKEVVTAKSMREPNKVICEIENRDVEVRKDHIIVVGREEPAIKISE
ncbi:MAG: 30S ribosomal protein S4e [Candidatus Aenigmarchaeota archaeon]|nr:30S ribosomal protein S4e [Candidatus Aenigmarchaeota archaeon]